MQTLCKPGLPLLTQPRLTRAQHLGEVNCTQVCVEKLQQSTMGKDRQRAGQSSAKTSQGRPLWHSEMRISIIHLEIHPPAQLEE